MNELKPETYEEYELIAHSLADYDLQIYFTIQNFLEDMTIVNYTDTPTEEIIYEQRSLCHRSD